MSYFLRNDIYAEDKLRADEEALRRFYYNHGYADFRVISVVRRSRPLDQRIRHQLHGRGRRALHLRRRHHREQYRRRHRRSLGGADRRPGQATSTAPRTSRTRSSRLTEKVAGIGLCLRPGHAARRPQFREPHDLGRLRDRSGPAHLCRAHRNSRQRTLARLRDPPRVRHQRRRRLQSGAGAARQAPPRSSRLLHIGRDFDGAGLGARPGHAGGRRGREVDRRVLDRRRLHDRRRDVRAFGRRLDHRTQLPRPRPVHQLLGRRRPEFARLHAVLHRALFPRAAHRRRLRHLPSDARLTTTTRATSRAARSASACRSRRPCRRTLAYNLSQGRIRIRRQLPDATG